MWIDGFPGSASTLATNAFRHANPGARISERRYLPPAILHSLYNFKPGIFLIRQPEDAVISWAILSRASLGECLDYYNDFHRMLAPNAPWLFIVTFEELVSQFAMVMESFNIHFHRHYAASGLNPVSSFSATRQSEPPPADKSSGELKIVRPLPSRPGLRQELRQRLRESPALRRKLERARRHYSVFVPHPHILPVPPLDLTTRHLPSLA